MFRFSKRDWAQLLGLLLVAVAVVSAVLVSDGLLEEDFWPETVARSDEPSVENFNPQSLEGVSPEIDVLRGCYASGRLLKPALLMIT